MTKDGFDGVVRKIVNRKETALLAFLPLPGGRSIPAHASQRRRAIALFFDSNEKFGHWSKGHYNWITCADLMSSLARIFSSNASFGVVSRFRTVNAVPPAWFRLSDIVAIFTPWSPSNVPIR